MPSYIKANRYAIDHDDDDDDELDRQRAAMNAFNGAFANPDPALADWKPDPDRMTPDSRFRSYHLEQARRRQLDYRRLNAVLSYRLDDVKEDGDVEKEGPKDAEKEKNGGPMMEMSNGQGMITDADGDYDDDKYSTTTHTSGSQLQYLKGVLDSSPKKVDASAKDIEEPWSRFDRTSTRAFATVEDFEASWTRLNRPSTQAQGFDGVVEDTTDLPDAVSTESESSDEDFEYTTRLLDTPSTNAKTWKEFINEEVEEEDIEEDAVVFGGWQK